MRKNSMEAFPQNERAGRMCRVSIVCMSYACVCLALDYLLVKPGFQTWPMDSFLILRREP